MSYIDPYYHPTIQDTSATSTSTFFLYQLPNGTDTKEPCWKPSNYRRMIPKVESKWLKKQLKKTGRNTKSTLGSRSGNQYWLK